MQKPIRVGWPAAHRTFRRLAKATAPAISTAPDGDYSPDLRWVTREAVEEFCREHHADGGSFLDVGGSVGKHRSLAGPLDYFVLEFNQAFAGPDTIIGDICGPLEELPGERFDIVHSNNVFEHLTEPWVAAANCVALTRPGGLLVHVAPFSWRYHPVPVDCFRYTHTGLAHLFERTGEVETLVAGYDITRRREDLRGKAAHGRDRPPVDSLGGWRENWQTVWVGRRLG